MAQTPIWKSIADTLTADILDGQYATGQKLPTEAKLSARFGVNRHTVRHALAALCDDGLVFSRRGAGVFVAQTPTDYPIGRRVRFHQNLKAAGRVPAKTVLSLDTRTAGRREAEALGLDAGADVHAYEGLSLSDGQPIALFRSIFPAQRFPNLLQDLDESKSVTTALAQGGVVDYVRQDTRLTAKQATTTQALHLRISEGDPILRAISVNVDLDGRKIEYGYTWFAGDRVTLTLAGDKQVMAGQRC